MLGRATFLGSASSEPGSARNHITAAAAIPATRRATTATAIPRSGHRVDVSLRLRIDPPLALGEPTASTLRYVGENEGGRTGAGLTGWGRMRSMRCVECRAVFVPKDGKCPRCGHPVAADPVAASAVKKPTPKKVAKTVAKKTPKPAAKKTASPVKKPAAKKAANKTAKAVTKGAAAPVPRRSSRCGREIPRLRCWLSRTTRRLKGCQ